MKITENKPPAAGGTGEDRAAAARNPAAPAGGERFIRILSRNAKAVSETPAQAAAAPPKKQGVYAGKEGRTPDGETGAGAAVDKSGLDGPPGGGVPLRKKSERELPDAVPGAPGAASAQPLVKTETPVVERPAEAAPVADTRPISGLVQEIVVHANTIDRSEVELQFTSQTLSGLKVHLQSENGAISISFSPRTEQVSDLLARNVDSLAASLEARGIHIQEIRVHAASERSFSESASNRKYRGGQPDQGRRGGARQ